MTTIAERVTAGAALLDEHKPGWWKADAPCPVDLAALNLDDCERCILGQIFGEDHDEYCGYDAGREVLGLLTPTGPDDYGFDGGYDDIRALGTEWARVITARREAAA